MFSAMAQVDEFIDAKVDAVATESFQRSSSNILEIFLKIVNDGNLSTADLQVTAALIGNMLQMQIGRAQMPVNLTTVLLAKSDCPKNWILNEKLTHCVPNPLYYDLTCFQNRGEVFIENALLQMFDLTWSVRLNDGRCDLNPVVNSAGTKFFFPYDDCNTELRQEGHTLVYTNYLELYSEPHKDGIRTQSMLRLPVHCSFPTLYDLTTETHVAHADFVVSGTDEEAKTEDGFQVLLFTDNQFNVERPNKEFTIMETIYFHVTWAMPYVGLSYQVTSCGLQQNGREFNFIDQVMFKLILFVQAKK